MNFLLIDSMLHASYGWNAPYVYVVDPAGAPLFTGADAMNHANDPWVGNDAVAFDDNSGQVYVNDAIPDAGHGDALASAGADGGDGDWASGDSNVGGGSD